MALLLLNLSTRNQGLEDGLMCFCRYDIDSMYEKYKDLHPDEASFLTVGDWFNFFSSPSSHDGKTLRLLYQLNLKQPLPQTT